MKLVNLIAKLQSEPNKFNYQALEEHYRLENNVFLANCFQELIEKKYKKNYDQCLHSDEKQ